MSFLIMLAIALSISYLIAQKAGQSDHSGNAIQIPWRRLVHLVCGGILTILFLLILTAHTSHQAELFIFLALMVVGAICFEIYVREFFKLMELSDDDFPGRNDKLIWALFMIVLPPIGVTLFRAYRLRRWPELNTKPASRPGVADYF